MLKTFKLFSHVYSDFNLIFVGKETKAIEMFWMVYFKDVKECIMTEDPIFL